VVVVVTVVMVELGWMVDSLRSSKVNRESRQSEINGEVIVIQN
jgi:hypothetical protein